MCCGKVGYKTGGGKKINGKIEKITPEGLYMSHAYSLIDTFELENGLKLCKLRNPWGALEW